MNSLSSIAIRSLFDTWWYFYSKKIDSGEDFWCFLDQLLRYDSGKIMGSENVLVLSDANLQLEGFKWNPAPEIFTCGMCGITNELWPLESFYRWPYYDKSNGDFFLDFVLKNVKMKNINLKKINKRFF